jgi:glycosyltransferase involved in cell wall biosynthesis
VTSPEVVVVVHEGRRSGPPIYAFHLVSWLRANTDLDIGVLVLAPGPLVEDFRGIGPTFEVADLEDGGRALLDAARLVYVNTAVSGEVLVTSGAQPRSVLTHVHELDIGLRHYLPAPTHDHLFAVTDHFLVGPDIARDNLVAGHGVPTGAITQVPYFVPPHPPLPERSATSRAELGLPADAVIIGACGTRDWRKAPDLFLQLSWLLDRRRLPVELHHVWLGSAIPTEPHWDQQSEIERLDRRGRVDFVDHQALPQRWMAEFDVFTLTSREDCFPLVCLEAAELSTPVVCFDNGGIPEMLRACDGGRVVAYPDLQAMADEVARLALDAEERQAMGARARAHVSAHHQLDRAGPLVAAAMAGMLA